MSDAPSLKRGLGLTLLVLYGLGTTVGAGIYVLVGEVAGVAGYAAPFSFLIAAALAGLTAASFAELSVRYPVSAGEAAYVRNGFDSASLATLVGLMVIAAGTVSAAAIANGFVGYIGHFVDLPASVTILLLVSCLTTIAIWGIVESVTVAAILTLVEVGGLLIILWVAGGDLEGPARIVDALPGGTGAVSPVVVLSAAILAFYAFIGFEDMVNVAEEVTDTKCHMPKAIFATLAITALLYVSVTIVAVLTVPPSELSSSDAPLALIYERATGREPAIISAIGSLAVVNGALIQIIMASRVVYGMANRGLLSRVLGHVNSRTRTPLNATLFVGAVVLVLALWQSLVTLASITSLITLMIFALVNLALIRIRVRHKGTPQDRLVPGWVPMVGFLASGSLAIYQIVMFVVNGSA